ncbi:unnamed protein product [Knipowitschia caucasica]
MDGVKDEVDTWGPVELLLSQNQGSAQLHTRIHPTIKDEVAETDSGSNCEYPEEGHTEEHLCIHRVEQPPGATVTSVCASCVQGEPLEEEHKDKRNNGEMEIDIIHSSSFDAEDSGNWDREPGTKLWTGRVSDCSLETNDNKAAKGPEDWRQISKENDYYPAQTTGHSKSDQNVHKCSECGKTFTDKLYLKRHLIRHTGRRPFTCSVCKKGFTQNAHLRKHTRCHTGEKPFTCPRCGATFGLKQNLHRHMASHSGAKSFICSVCKKGFTQKCHLRRHMGLHLGDKLCTCPEKTCEHVESGNGQFIALTAKKSLVCPFCSKGFTRKDHLSSHLSTHTGDKQFDCLECEAKFNLKQSLERHMAVHSGEKPFKCPECEKRFTRNSSLKLHMRTHTGEKPFSCSECDAKFNRKENFLRHLGVHTGERPYSCPVCKKDFVRKPSLDKHMKSHFH